jgi:hypothetical protein
MSGYAWSEIGEGVKMPEVSSYDLSAVWGILRSYQINRKKASKKTTRVDAAVLHYQFFAIRITRHD